jgi:glycosyltransferase involved in cell wall biosynthesis
MIERELLVTIITPTYNRADYLDETIQSVLNQDYLNLEYIVLDDGSKDNTIEILKKYGDRITWYTHTNMGETMTVNKGLSMAHGDIIGIVNSDDPLLPGVVSISVAVFKEHPDILLVYPDWDEIGPDSKVLKHIYLPHYDFVNMLVENNVGMGPGVFFRRWAVEKLGGRDVRFKYAGDLEFWYRLALHGKFFHISQALATHRVHPDSASVTDQGRQMADEIVRMIHNIFSYPDFPPELKSVQNQVYSRVHHSATLYCGSDTLVFLRHMVLSFWFSPRDFLNRFFKYLPNAVRKRIARIGN